MVDCPYTLPAGDYAGVYPCPNKRPCKNHDRLIILKVRSALKLEVLKAINNLPSLGHDRNRSERDAKHLITREDALKAIKKI